MLRCTAQYTAAAAAAAGARLRLQHQVWTRHLSQLRVLADDARSQPSFSHVLNKHVQHDNRHQGRSPQSSSTSTSSSFRCQYARQKFQSAQYASKRCFSSSPLTSSSQSNAFHAVTGYAFAGKPRTRQDEEKMQQHFAGAAAIDAQEQKENTKGKSTPARVPRQGFASDTKIGAWVDATLSNGEAGEDAVLFEKMKGPGDVVFGVADGVGGWSEEGIDPALFSQSLMFHSAEYAKQFYACPERLEEEAEDEEATSTSSSLSSSPSTTATATAAATAAATASPPSSTADGSPTNILEYAYRKTLKEEGVPAGSSTACVLTFDASKGILRAANLGDSGFLVLRPAIGNDGETSTKGGSSSSSSSSSPATSSVLLTVHHQSKPQTFGFNAPYQLSKLPTEYQSDNQIVCTPSKATFWRERVLDGDLVLVATDGFWDNVSVQEVLQLVQFIKDKHRTAFVDRMLDISNNFLAEEEDLANVLAHNLLSYALMCQFSTTKTSPFEREAARHGIRYPGGKVDDVAIIVSLIIER